MLKSHRIVQSLMELRRPYILAQSQIMLLCLFRPSSGVRLACPAF